MRTSKSGKPAASATCEPASPGSRRLPRHANQQVREADDFREMLISKSGKPATSATHFRLILFSLTTWNSPARSGCLKFRTEVREIRTSREAAPDFFSPGRQPWVLVEAGTQALKGRQRICRPFRARNSKTTLFPGLTPWAELWRRFAARSDFLE